MTKFPNEFLSSEFIAGSLNINPVLVRKEIGNLKKNGIVESREGKFGGTRLAKPAKDITLEHVFNLTFDCVSLGYAKNNPNPACPVGKKINEALDELYQNINKRICGELKDIDLVSFSNQF